MSETPDPPPSGVGVGLEDSPLFFRIATPEGSELPPIDEETSFHDPLSPRTPQEVPVPPSLDNSIEVEQQSQDQEPLSEHDEELVKPRYDVGPIILGGRMDFEDPDAPISLTLTPMVYARMISTYRKTIVRLENMIETRESQLKGMMDKIKSLEEDIQVLEDYRYCPPVDNPETITSLMEDLEDAHGKITALKADIAF